MRGNVRGHHPAGEAGSSHREYLDGNSGPRLTVRGSAAEQEDPMPVPVIVDAGVGTASDAALARATTLLWSFDGVLRVPSQCVVAAS